MDYSSLTEAQKLQQQYQQYQAQAQQHQQQPQEQQQPYDPAQAQSYEAYYAYQQQQYDASASQHQYDAYHQQYYPHDYAAYQQQQQQPMAQPADTSFAQSVPPDTAQAHQQQGSGAAPGHGYAHEQQSSYQGMPGLNPAAAAAVAALSQLTQFAGTMDAAERAMAGYHHERQWHAKNGGMMGPMGGGQHHPHPHHLPAQHGAVVMRPGVGGRSPYRGGGRRGGGPLRGGGSGRGNFGHHPPRPDGGFPRFRGRGRGGRMGRDGGKRFHHTVSESQSPYPMETPSQSSAAAPATAPTPPRRPLLPLAWCDICRVDCNSLEILEQHKNGKRHKKTVQRFEEIQAQQKLLAESQAKFTMQRSEETQTQPKLVAESQAKVNEQPEMVAQEIKEQKAVQEGEENKASAASENLEDASLVNENKMESEQESHTAPEHSEGAKLEATTLAPTTEALMRRPRIDGYDRRRPPKRKMTRFGRGGKRLRYFETERSRPLERPKEQPRVCTLCNIMCDTQAVFECHLAGKKHISRIKRFQGHGAVYGPITVYIPPNQQPSVHIPPGVEPFFYGLQTPEMMQQAAYMHEGLAVETYGHQQEEQAVSEPQSEQDGEQPETEQDGEEPQTEQEGEPHGQVSETEGQLAVIREAEGNNAVLEFEVKESSVAVEVPASENAIMEIDNSLTIAEDAVPVLEYGVTSAQNVIFPGLDVKVEEPSADHGELGNQDGSLH